MADNVSITAGSGTNVATDDVSGVHYQKTKQALGGNDAAQLGATPYHLINTAAANQDATVVKASPGVIYGFDFSNDDTVDVYVKLYDKATGPTSADTPKKVLKVPAGSGWSASRPHGLAFAAGIALRITTAIADNSTAGATASKVAIGLEYV